jgi:hypothetical protein
MTLYFVKEILTDRDSLCRSSLPRLQPLYTGQLGPFLSKDGGKNSLDLVAES